jgi:hypothetical protein
MILIKKADVAEHFAARRALKLVASRTVRPTDTGGELTANLGTMGVDAVRPDEDLSRQGSSPALTVLPKN